LIGHVKGIESRSNVSQVFHDNPRGSRLRGGPKHRWWNCVQTDIDKWKIKHWTEGSKNRVDWECIKEVKGCIRLRSV